MRHYSWILPHSRAFELYELLPGGTLFEEGVMWRVDYFCPESEVLSQDVLTRYPEHSLEDISDQDWLEASQKALAPVEVGPFYIHTPYYERSLHHPVSLCVDAGMAFGSGHHETTQGCLFLIHELFQHAPWHHALDLGCGSGILALAMSGVRPGSAVGSDNDPEAVAVAQENSRINGIPCDFFLCEGMPTSEDPFDLIVANLYSYVLVELAPAMAGASHLILSGMMQHQAPQVQEVYSAHGWTCSQRRDLGQWTSLWLSRG